MSVFSGIFPTQTCQIKRNIEGYTDPGTGQWVPGGEKLIATVEADIQPKSGLERATELQTKYESDHISFIDFEDIQVTVEVLVMMGMPAYEQNVELQYIAEEYGIHVIQPGDIFIDPYDKKYDVKFSKYWGDHYEVELKARE